MNLLNNTV